MERVRRVMFEPPRCNARRDRDKACFGLMRKVPFITVRLGPNLHWLWHIWREFHIWCLNHPAGMGGIIETKNCFRFNSKVPFFTPRSRINFHCFWRMGRVWHVWCLIHPDAMRGETGSKPVSASWVKCPSLHPELEQTCIGCDACGVSATYDVWITPLEWEAL
jgi:hypothetical protein